MVRNQIGNLTPAPYFGHNLCFKCSNESCKPILDIYVPRDFQKYKEFFNPMSFDPWNCPLKIWRSIGTPIPKVGVHLGMWGFNPSHFLTLLGAWNVTLGFHSWPTPLLAFAFIASPRLSLRHHHLKSLLIIFKMYVDLISFREFALSWCSILFPLSHISPRHDAPKHHSHPYNHHHYSSLNKED
jgi:hypothetical protein